MGEHQNIARLLQRRLQMLQIEHLQSMSVRRLSGMRSYRLRLESGAGRAQGHVNGLVFSYESHRRCGPSLSCASGLSDCPARLLRQRAPFFVLLAFVMLEHADDREGLMMMKMTSPRGMISRPTFPASEKVVANASADDTNRVGLLLVQICKEPPCSSV